MMSPQISVPFPADIIISEEGVRKKGLGLDFRGDSARASAEARVISPVAGFIYDLPENDHLEGDVVQGQGLAVIRQAYDFAGNTIWLLHPILLM